MSKNIVVPELGESVVEATVIRWLKSEGEQVNMGDTLVELETEKANFEVAAESSGVLEKILKKSDEDVEIGEVLGTIDENGTPQQAKQESSPEAKPQEKEEPADIDVSKIEGTGVNNKITKEDVEKYVTGETSAQEEKNAGNGQEPNKSTLVSAQPQAPVIITDHDDREERVRMSARRRTIARRMLEAQRNAAILTTFNEVDMGPVIEVRNRRKDSFFDKHGVKLGFSSFFVKAVIGALKEFPAINAEIQDDEFIVYKNYYDIGMAIGAEGGLVVPVLRDTDRMTFAEIEKKIVDYVKKANDGSLSLQEIRGGTFTITNGGVFGSLMSTPILNPPQVGILGLHKIEERPVADKGEIKIKPMMYTALSYDHRIVDGKEAVQFLVKIKELIEDPEVLLLEG